MTRVFLLWWIFIWVESGFERGWKKVGQVKLCLIIIITTATATMYHHQGTFVRRKKEKKCTTSYDRHHHQNSVLFWSSITFFPFCVKSEIALFLRICSKLLVLIISRKEDREKGNVGKKICCWLLKRRKKVCWHINYHIVVVPPDKKNTTYDLNLPFHFYLLSLFFLFGERIWNKKKES